MQKKRQKGDVDAVVISVIMHLILFGLLILSSLYHNIDIMGGGEGDDGEVIGAVMVDTGSAAQEWGRIQQQKKGQADKQKKQELEDKKQEEQQRQQELEKKKEQEKQKQLAEQKKQQEEKARLEALEKQKEAEEAKAKQ
ncbi:MAG: cell envelope integrity protein TolA, partial [Moraxella sp.]